MKFLNKHFCNLSFAFLIVFLIPSPAQSGWIELDWQPNAESDLSGYKVYYGKSSRNYDHVLDVGRTTYFRVNNLDLGEHFFFAVTAYDYAGNESDFSSEVDAVVTQASDETAGEETLLPLAYNFPNPFRIEMESTVIRYELTGAAEVTIEIYDLDNKKVNTILLNRFKQAGEHSEDRWSGRNAQGDFVANGIYFCKIQAGGIQRVIKIAVVR